ncbi:MAG: hypothetical protein ACFCU9_04235 [Cyanophyceae cyanobacterium]
MLGYYEIETEIPASHQLNIHLTSEIPIGTVKVAIIDEISNPAPQQNRMAALLDSLPELQGEGLSKEKIQSFIRQERESWVD